MQLDFTNAEPYVQATDLTGAGDVTINAECGPMQPPQSGSLASACSEPAVFPPARMETSNLTLHSLVPQWLDQRSNQLLSINVLRCQLRGQHCWLYQLCRLYRLCRLQLCRLYQLC